MEVIKGGWLEEIQVVEILELTTDTCWSFDDSGGQGSSVC